ncbi:MULTISPECIES: peptidylprolyl isomerase [unclassified Delftia]|uniref:peptidylprolyl isomerase n=1 Tax=unclassified Delftia TaxID=2613839 RepID=UPI001E00B9BD|nr:MULTISPECIES: peptidylprolyl isomerase [unclassified Delftia]MBS3720026.1 Foldase protein PrsA [Delftia sp. PE138]
MSNSIRRFRHLTCVSLVVLTSPFMLAAHAAPLVQGDGVAVTADDIKADGILRVPEHVRAELYSKPQSVEQIAGNLHVRRVMAEQAVKDGLGDRPEVKAAIQIMRDKVLSDAMLAEFDRKHAPSEQDAERLARNIYAAQPERFKAEEQVRVRHILVSGQDDAAKAKAEQLLKQLRDGADFAKLAEQESADKSNAAKGGDLGFFGKGKMVPAFETAAFGLKKKGELSDVVATQFGFHIIQLEEHRAAGTKLFEEVRPALLREVRSSAQRDARQEMVQKIQKDAKIDKAAVEAYAAEFQKQLDAAGKPASASTTAKP